LAVLPGAIYIERCSLHNPAEIRKTKKAVKHAFELQVDAAQGLSMVEILSACPTNWKMTPAKSMEWIEKELTKAFPLGCLKDVK
jgi:2-oxoglutarate ferredoxin oxidoreductase subunit beta